MHSSSESHDQLHLQREYCALKPEDNLDEFQILLRQIHMIAGSDFPNTAVYEIPQILSDETKQQVLNSNMQVQELTALFLSAINEINHGSIESLDSLIQNRLVLSSDQRD